MKRCTLSKNRQRTPLSPFLFQLLSFSFGLLVAEGAYLYNISSLTVSNKTSSSVYLTWNEPHGSSSFFIVNWTGDSVNNSSNTSNTSYTVTGLTAGVNYIFTVTAVAADNQTTGAPAQTSAFTKPSSTANTVPIVLGVVLPIICLFIMVIIIVIVRRLQIHHSPNQNEMKVPTESSDLQATYMNLAHVQRPAVDSATNSNIMEIVNSKL
ncbi:hypothetical protein KOW79_012367 [Hemibagrus wyckioides]|uniref:Tissue factor n=1 Tax=Hemibagrus wyckioides TaxID=337641 RepID=A0A9D3SHB3_9TELE|nr:hypothetical protein KOW79_012367 [Hemibagrus wyckioides]